MEFVFLRLFAPLEIKYLINYQYTIDTLTAVRSSESSATDTTKTFTGESSLTGAIIQTWAATARILL